MSLVPQPPLPAPPVLTPPAGWLGYLGIKSGGKQPGVVAAYLTPTLDMDRFYRAGARTPIRPGTAGIPATYNASVVIYTVPQGKVWLIEAFTIATNVLGAAANVVLTLQAQDAGGNVFAQETNPIRGLTGEVMNSSLNGPLIALPGSTLVAFQTAGAAPTAFVYFGNVTGVEVAA